MTYSIGEGKNEKEKKKIPERKGVYTHTGEREREGERDRIYGKRDMYGREEDKHTGISDLVYDWARYTRMYIIGEKYSMVGV